MNRMDAKKFFREFKESACEEVLIGGRRLFDIYKSDAEYTKAVTQIINKIIERAGFTPQNEYFRIDVVGWNSRYKAMEEDAKNSRIELNPHLWDLWIAVEHENSKRDWTDEVMKLIHVKCPLKVVIGYNYSNERGEEERKKLVFVAKWMQEIKAFSIGTDEEYLIILGNGYNHKTHIQDYDRFDYRGYLLNQHTKEFEEILEFM